MATTEENYLARRLFKCRAILANAKAFQDLFWDVMKAKHGQDFATVAPQGKKGDGGNDGYLPKDKHYYQVFAPIDPKARVTAGVAKLGADFAKVNGQWGGPNGPGLRSFSFVFNDKYEGAPKEIEVALNTLRAKNSALTFSQYCCRELEADFMGLVDTIWDQILGAPLPNPEKISKIDYGVLGEVIYFIMASEVPDSDTRLDLPPELNQKITVNNLGFANGLHIQHGALMTGHVERFLKAHSSFALKELRDRVVGIYETAKQVTMADAPSTGTVVDAVFALFRRSMFPKGITAAASVAVDAIIGHFFESCDIFDPKAAKGLPGASP